MNTPKCSEQGLLSRQIAFPILLHPWAQRYRTQDVQIYSKDQDGGLRGNYRILHILMFQHTCEHKLAHAPVSKHVLHERGPGDADSGALGTGSSTQPGPGPGPGLCMTWFETCIYTTFCSYVLCWTYVHVGDIALAQTFSYGCINNSTCWNMHIWNTPSWVGWG